MAPKFRGNSDDWLDDEGESQGRKRPKGSAKGKRAKVLLKNTNAIVTEVFPNQCQVRMDVGRERILCSYRRTEVFGKTDQDYRERSPVAVGDRVQVSKADSRHGVIEGVAERRNSLSRVAPGRDNQSVRHVIAANVDGLIIVASVKEPAFSPGLVDRYLVAASSEGISPLICVTKIDLLAPNDAKPWQLYRDLGFEVVEVSSRRGHGVEALRTRLTGKTWVFCGHSGVGKTSLLRVLLEEEVGKVGALSEATGKGKHTTTASVLLDGPDDSAWIDTPGVREFALFGIEPEKLARYFSEFQAVRCPSASCLHEDEEGCQARSLPRHSSYYRILKSLRELGETDSQVGG